MRAGGRQIEVLKRFALRQTVVANRRDGSISAALLRSQRGRKTPHSGQEGGRTTDALSEGVFSKLAYVRRCCGGLKSDFCLLGN